MPRIMVFDVNETLLDLAALDPVFERVFGDPAARREWFAALKESWLVLTVLGRYRAFGDLARAALEVVAGARGVTLAEEDRRSLLGGLRELPAHGDAAPALARLRAAGLRLAALSNGTAEALHAQLRHAGLDDYFEAQLSVDAVQRFKPAGEPYAMAARELDVAPGGLRMVAAHAWDLAGAAAAGCATAFVRRPGQQLNPAWPEPDLAASDLEALAGRILEVERL